MPIDPYKPYKLANLSLKNRFVRSATFEGMADKQGNPSSAYQKLYFRLAKNQVGLIITGFSYVHPYGRAIQPGQAGFDTDQKVEKWAPIVDKIHTTGTKIIPQLAHVGRQTISSITGQPCFAPSTVTCSYFRQQPMPLGENQIIEIIEHFITAAMRSKKAGFDGVQIHMAHGYLLHQFLSRHTNRRRDNWGGSLENRFRIVKEIISGIKDKCGDSFPVLIKMSAQDDRPKYFTFDEAFQVCNFLSDLKVEAIEVSYGTMEKALNIIRGDIPAEAALDYNPTVKTANPLLRNISKKLVFPILKKQFIPYCDLYNLENAKRLQQNTNLPIILVGGIRKMSQVEDILNNNDAQLISFCRGLICQPDLLQRFKDDTTTRARCINCNLCTILGDSGKPLKCYFGKYRSIYEKK